MVTDVTCSLLSQREHSSVFYFFLIFREKTKNAESRALHKVMKKACSESVGFDFYKLACSWAATVQNGISIKDSRASDTGLVPLFPISFTACPPNPNHTWLIQSLVSNVQLQNSKSHVHSKGHVNIRAPV